MIIVLFEPQIPQNTGNIVRTCAITRSKLILVRPLGFRVCDRNLKRAGLDYWDDVDIEYIDNLDLYLENTTSQFYFFSSKASTNYTEITFKEDDLLIFGSETKGLPDRIHTRWKSQFYTIPMAAGQRSLNLANSVAIVLYEGLRQQSFKSLIN